MPACISASISPATMALVCAWPVIPRRSTGRPFFLNSPESPMSHTKVELGTCPLMPKRIGAMLATALAPPLGWVAAAEPQAVSSIASIAAHVQRFMLPATLAEQLMLQYL